MKNVSLKTVGQACLIISITLSIYIGSLYIVSVNDAFKTLTTKLTEQTELLAKMNIELDAKTKQLKTQLDVVEDITNDKIDYVETVIKVNKSTADADLALKDVIVDSVIKQVNEIFDNINEAIKKPSYDYLKNITVFIQAINVKKGYGWVGTGIIVKETADFTYILTNNHVSDGCESENKCSVREDNTIYNIEVVKRSLNNDMVLIRVSGKITGKEVVKGFSTVKPQDRVFLVGHNLGRPFFYSEGTVSGYDVNLEADLVVGLPAGPGNSGSGVVNKDGEIVGLLYAVNITGNFPYQTMDLTHALCVNSDNIQEFLKEII